MSLTRKASSAAKKPMKPPRQDLAAALAKREAELAEARRETQEAREQQKASAEVLAVIGKSVSDPVPVFEAILDAGHRLFGSDEIGVYTIGDDGMVRVAAWRGPRAEEVRRDVTPLAESVTGRIIGERRTHHIPDLRAEPNLSPTVRERVDRLGSASLLYAPMLWEDRGLGSILVARSPPRPFSDREQALLQTFADQAAIAIENARLFRETQESLRQQTATSDILRVIASSPDDLQPVLDRLAETTCRLCGAYDALILLREGDDLRIAAHYGPIPLPANFVKRRISRDWPPGRAVADRKTVHVHDLAAAQDEYPVAVSFSKEAVRAATPGLAWRTALATPLMREGEAVGAIVLRRAEVWPFAEAQIALLQTFADQAVIAIQNVRLFDEVQARTRDLTEALRRQKASADILRVISGSLTDVMPAFDAIALTAAQLFRCDRAGFFLVDGDRLLNVTGADPERLRDKSKLAPPTPIDPSANFPSRPVADKRTLYVPDFSASDVPEYERFVRDQYGLASALYLPMLRGEQCVGVFLLWSSKIDAFREKDIALAESFRDQALIAIENTRLFNETQEALQQQTATADVLKVISRSAFDLQTVFDTLLTSAVKLAGAVAGSMCVRDGNQFPWRAHSGISPSLVEHLDAHPAAPGRGSTADRVLLSGEAVCIPDILEDPEYVLPTMRLGTPTRSTLGVPLLRDDRVEGALVLVRQEPGTFHQRQIDLVKTFADQAVIAIENVRLFDEVQARTKDLQEALQQQTATADVLKVISRSAFDLQAVFDTLIASAVELSGAHSGAICVRDGEVFRYRSSSGPGASPELHNYLVEHPPTPGRGSIAGRAVLSQQVEQIPDLREDAEYSVPISSHGNPARALLGVPLLGKDKVEGAIVLTRLDSGAFPDRQIEILQTFADQAVIAIENVRLFDEVQARTRDLSEALQQQTATADVLKVISRSAFDLQTVLDTLIRSAGELCEAANGVVYLQEGDAFHLKAHAGLNEDLVRYLRQNPQKPGRGSGGARVLLTGAIQNIPDVQADADYDPELRATATRTRALLGVPLMGNQGIVGAIVLTRPQPGAFTQREIEIVQTFADQAVIAVENVRLFDEVQAKTRDVEEALAQQTATADVLKVISRSVLDLDSVLQTLIDTAVRLAHGSRGGIWLQRGDALIASAFHSNTPDTLREYLANATWRLDGDTPQAQAAREGRIVHVPDFSKLEDENTQEVRKRAAYGAGLWVPLIGERQTIGVIGVPRDEPIAFTDREIEIVKTFADQAVIAIENARLFDEVQARTKELAASLDDLRKAQDRLIQSEKLASLGQLTAGIAHEIKNPLNFVNNFSALSRELVGELADVIKGAPLDDAVREEAEELIVTIDGNLDKVVSHGKRADSIVKNMLLHSREGSGERATTNVNAMVEEALNLAYHGARAERPGFNVTIAKSLDPNAGEAEVYAQEMTRVLLNLISNGFYATAKRKQAEADGAYEPTLTASTRDLGSSVEIAIRDNGTGIPDEVKAKMFNPFFTTKPAGEGTGLGLSLSHDIVVKQHGGTLEVSTKPGSFTEFTITLPRAGAGA